MYTPPVMQLENEHGRVTVDGRLIDGGGPCTFLVIHKFGRKWAFYPHGAGHLGLWMPEANALTVAQFILASAE